MNLQIQITAYDRIDLFVECLESLRKSVESYREHNGLSVDFNVYVDHQRGSIQYDAFNVARLGLKNASSIRLYGSGSDTPLGADLNILRSINWINYDEEQTFVIKIDSDVIVAKNFIHDMVELATYCGGMATTTLYGRDSLDVKISKSNHITKWALTGACFCVDAETFSRITPMAEALIKTYKQSGHNPATTEEEWRVMKDLLRLYRPLHHEWNSPHRDFLLNSQVPNTGSDAMIAVAAWCLGVPICSYSVNRAIHPSDTGVNTTKEFHTEYYAGVTLDDLPPADPTKFHFV